MTIAVEEHSGRLDVRDSLAADIDEGFVAKEVEAFNRSLHEARYIRPLTPSRTCIYYHFMFT